MSKPTESISRRDEIQSLSNGILKCIPATSTYPSQKGLQFGERLLNGREIGRVGRQEQETTSSGFNGLPHARPLMNAQVIQDHDLPWFQTGSKKLFHIELKSSAIRRPIQQECGSHSLQRQGGHQCHIGSIIAGHFAVSSLSSGSIGVQRGHGNVGAGLIHKHQIRTGQVCCLFAPGSTFGFLLLAGSYGLFFRVQPRACLARVMLAGLTWMPCVALNRRQWSSRRRSGWASNWASKWACNAAPFTAGRPGILFGSTWPLSRRCLR